MGDTPAGAVDQPPAARCGLGFYLNSSALAVLSGDADGDVVDLDVLGSCRDGVADDSRRRLLVALIDGPAYPSELADDLGLTRANVSNHLTCLRGCGIVTASREGRRVRYELTDPRLASVLRDLLELRLAADPTVCPNAVHDGCC